MTPIPEEYFLRELRIVQNLGDPRRVLPSAPPAGSLVLDVGCGIGHTLTAVEFTGCRERHGIDVDADAIANGRVRFPGLTLTAAPAEAIPYPDDTFDLTYSRVALPYSNVPVSVAEMIRVTKPQGIVWMSLHPPSMEWGEIVRAVRSRSIKRLVDRGYVLANSVWLAATQRCFPRPWSPTRESFQFAGPMRRLLAQQGLVDVSVSRKPHLILRGRKP